MPITRHDQPVYKLVCDNTSCGNEDWTAIDPDHEIKYFANPQDARTWGSANGWQIGDTVLCPADAADALSTREQAEEITAAINYALGETP
jgi:hypothetical protein